MRSIRAMATAETTKDQMQQQLPEDHAIGKVTGLDETGQQVDRADADDGRGQLDLEHRGVDVTEPLGLVRMVFQPQPLFRANIIVNANPCICLLCGMLVGQRFRTKS